MRPEDVPGECNARLYIGDDHGDNRATMRCTLPEGHESRHQESWAEDEKLGAHHCTVTWLGDDRRYLRGSQFLRDDGVEGTVEEVKDLKRAIYWSNGEKLPYTETDILEHLADESWRRILPWKEIDLGETFTVRGLKEHWLKVPGGSLRLNPDGTAPEDVYARYGIAATQNDTLCVVDVVEDLETVQETWKAHLEWDLKGLENLDSEGFGDPDKIEFVKQLLEDCS